MSLNFLKDENIAYKHSVSYEELAKYPKLKEMPEFQLLDQTSNYNLKILQNKKLSEYFTADNFKKIKLAQELNKAIDDIYFIAKLHDPRMETLYQYLLQEGETKRNIENNQNEHEKKIKEIYLKNYDMNLLIH